jgi:DNA-binding transcriptional LysR family regulator
MDVRQLRCFVAVAEELHFGRAAARLHVAGPAVSQTIRSMEAELGLTLFNRTNRRVELTEAGTVLLAEARGVLDRFDGAMTTMAGVRRGERGRVRIGAVPALPPRLIPRLLEVCAAQTPRIEVVVTAARSGAGVSEALDSEADMVLVRGEVEEPLIASRVVAREPVGVALRDDHPLAARAEISPRELTGVPLIAFPRQSDVAEYDRVMGALAAGGLPEPRVVHESHPGAVDASLRLVAAGVGASLKLRSEVDAFAGDHVEWRPLADAQLDVIISAAWRSDRETPALERLLPLLAGIGAA